MLMAQRLRKESEVVLQKDLLASLTEVQVPGVLEVLLEFVPAPTLRESYGKALVVQIGADFVQMEVVRALMVKRFDREFAFRVVRNFPLEGLTAQQRLDLDRKHATAVWDLLMNKGAGNGNASYAADAVTRLRDLMVQEPESLVWPIYLVEIELQRKEVGAILPLFTELLSKPGIDLKKKWELGIAILLAVDHADTPQLRLQGRTLLVALEALGQPDEDYLFLLEQVREKFPAPPEPEAALPPPTPVEDAAESTEELGLEEKPAPEAGQEEPGATPPEEPAASESPQAVSDPLSSGFFSWQD